MPKIEMPKVERVGMPSPGEIVHGYLNSDFHSKNFKQPFTIKVRLEITGNKISRRWHSHSSFLASQFLALDIQNSNFRQSSGSSQVVVS